MKSRKGRFVAYLLTVLMVVSGLPVTAAEHSSYEYEPISVVEYEYWQCEQEITQRQANLQEYEPRFATTSPGAIEIMPLSETEETFNVTTFGPAGTVGTLQNLIANAPTDGTVRVLRIMNSFDMTSAVTIPANTNIQIISGGSNVSLTRNSGTGRHFTVNGTLTLGREGDVAANLIALTRTTNLANDGGGVNIHANGTFVMNGGTISNNRAIGGAGVAVSGANSIFIMNGGTISNNAAGGHGGGGVSSAWGSGTTFVMNGGTISNNTATLTYNLDWLGGGGVEAGSGTFTMNGGTISNNQTNGSGGGVVVTGGIFNIYGGTITGNTAGRPGGAMRTTAGGATSVNINGAVTIDGEISIRPGNPPNITVRESGALIVPVGRTLTIASNTTLINSGTISNNGTIANSGIIINHGTVNNNGTINNVGTIYTVDGGIIGLGNIIGIGSIIELIDDGGEPVDVTTFEQLQFAVSTAPANGTIRTIRVAGNINMTSAITILSNTNIILISDGNDAILTRNSGNARHFSVNGTLTLGRENDPAANRISLTRTGNLAGTGGGITVNNGGTFNMRGGTISNNRASLFGGGVQISNGGTFNMQGGAITNNTETSTSNISGGGRSGGGGVGIAGGGTFIMAGGIINGNTAAAHGGGVNMLPGSTFTMTGGTISENHAASGGGISVVGDFTMNGGYIRNNTADFWGGGVVGNFSHNGGVIENNTPTGDTFDATTFAQLQSAIPNAPTNVPVIVRVMNNIDMTSSIGVSAGRDVTLISGGGDVALTRNSGTARHFSISGFEGIIGTLTLGREGDVEANRISLTRATNLANDGGGISIGGGGAFIMRGGTISNNRTSSTATGGGGIAINAGSSGNTASFRMYGGTITNNTSVNNGGGVGIWHLGESSFTMHGGIISSNNAGTNGGGVWISSRSLALRDSPSFTMHGGTISGNSATTNGGGVFVVPDSVDGSAFIMNNGTIMNNTAGVWNGGVRGYFIHNGGIIENNTPEDGLTETSVTTFAQLQAAISNAPNNVPITIRVMNNIDMISSITVSSGRDITLISGGGDVALTRNSGTARHFSVSGILNLGRKGNAEANRISVTRTENLANNGGGITVNNNGIFNVYGGAISNNRIASGGGISISSGGTLNMFDGIITENIATTNGGGVNVASGGAFVMNGGLITENTANTTSSPNGGVHVVNTGAFTRNGGIVCKNTPTDVNNAICVGCSLCDYNFVPTITFIPANVAITDANLVQTVNVTGMATGNINVTYTIPTELQNNVSVTWTAGSSGIIITGTRPDTNVPALTGSFNVSVTREGVTESFVVTVNLTTTWVAPTVPAAINNLTAAPGSGQVTLNWTAPNNGGSGIIRYEFRQRTGTGEWGVWTTTGATTTTFIRTGLTGGTSFGFQVRAVNAIGYASESNIASATPFSLCPDCGEHPCECPASVTFTSSVNGTVGASASGIPTITSGQEVQVGTSVTFTAAPGTGFRVARWYVGGVVVPGVTGTVLTRTVPVTGLSVHVEFGQGNIDMEFGQYSVIATIVPDDAGSFVETSFAAGMARLAVATNSGWRFDGWFENNVRVHGGAIYGFLVTRNRELEARFIEILPPTTINQMTIPNGTVGLSYRQQFSANGTAPITWTVASGALPQGLRLSASGLLSGTPVQAGDFNFTIRAGNSAGYVTRPFSLTITLVPPTAISPATLSDGIVGIPYRQAFSSGGSAPRTWTMASGELPQGLTLSTAGILSGTPETAGNWSFTVRVSNDAGYETRNFTMSTWAFDITATATPSGWGSITGIATNQGASVTLTATPSGNRNFGGWHENDASVTTSRDITVTTSGRNLEARFVQPVVQPVAPTSISSLSNTTGTIGIAYRQQLSTNSNATTPIAWTITMGTLPLGLELSSGGLLSGVPEQDGIFRFEVEARNAVGFVRREFALAILPSIGITLSAVPPQGGTVSGVEVAQGEAAVLTATPTEGWDFDGWFENDVRVYEDAEVSVTAVGRNLQARFTQYDYCGECGYFPCQCCEDCGEHPCICFDCGYCEDTGCAECSVGDCGYFPCRCCEYCGEYPCECPACEYCNEYPCICVTPQPDSILSVSTAFAEAGDNVSVQLRLDNNPGFAAMLMRLSFSEYLTLTGYTVGRPNLSAEALADLYDGFVSPEIGSDDTFMGWAARKSDTTISGVLLTLNFAVSSGAPNDTFLPVEIFFESYAGGSEEPTNADYETLAIGISNGGVQVQPFIFGDASGDGRVTSADSTVLARYLAGHNVTIDRRAMDLNDDGYIDGADLGYLVLWLVGRGVPPVLR